LTDDAIIEKIILPALKTASQTMPGLGLESPPLNLCLYGGQGAVLDSLNLVTFIFTLEETVQKATGQEIKISAEDLFNQEINPFSELRALSRLIGKKLERP
jgi:hypothetical protein